MRARILGDLRELIAEGALSECLTRKQCVFAVDDSRVVEQKPRLLARFALGHRSFPAERGELRLVGPEAGARCFGL